MTDPTSVDARPRHLASLPKNWHAAPREWRETQPHAFWMFFWVNFLLGTLGLWLPLINAAIGGHSTVLDELKKLLDAGGFYLYAVAFLAATVGAILSDLRQEAAEQSRGTKNLFAIAASSIFVVCVVLLQIQVLGPAPSSMWVNYILQFIVSVITVIVALYMHSIVQNEIGGSPKDDMERNAEEMKHRAAEATASKKDFE